MTYLKIYTDGGARGNPGPAALGVSIRDRSDGIVVEFGRHLGIMTNNQAEYHALIAGLEAARDRGASEVDCYLDSELVVKQMRREYRVKHPELQPLFLKAWTLIASFARVRFTHIPRAQNSAADRMVNEALDAVDR